jgi:hypothetical protein
VWGVRSWIFLVVAMGCVCSAHAATGRVVKVLPHFVDRQGKIALSPSLYERDAYQAVLRQNPDQRSGLRFDVQWKAKGPVWQPLKVKLELRGIAQGDLPKRLVIEKTVEKKGWLSRWASLELTGEAYKEFGEVTAWRVTLWEGDWPLGEVRSFLW